MLLNMESIVQQLNELNIAADGLTALDTTSNTTQLMTLANIKYLNK